MFPPAPAIPMSRRGVAGSVEGHSGGRMKRLQAVLGVIGLAVFATGMVAGTGQGVAPPTISQARPDFSGAWAAVTQGGGGGRSGGPTGTMGSGWGPSITIAQDPSNLTVERVFFATGDLQPALKFRYSLDGSVSRNTVVMGRGIQQQVSTATWEGDTLVITTVLEVPESDSGRRLTVEVKQALSLRPSASLVRPPSLVVETTVSGAPSGLPTTTRTVYARR